MKKKISSILFINLGILGGITPCYAGSYTPNDLVDGRLPSYDNNITLTLGDGNWSKEIVLPQKPKNGDIVNVKSNAAWDSKIVGNIIGFGSIKIKTNDRIELVYKPVTTSASAWTLKDETSPNNGGVYIANNKKYVGYFVADANWDKHLYLPDTKGVAEKIVVRSEAMNDTYIDHRMVAGNSDLKISTNQVAVFTWNSPLNKWNVFIEGDSSSLKSGVRKLAFFDMSLDTSVEGTELYNNGRMQKPIEITYKACLFEDAQEHDSLCNPVQLTNDEIRYYVKLGLYRRNDGNYPEELGDIYPEFIIDYEHDNHYQTRLPANYNTDTRKTTHNAQSRTARLWLRYNAKSINEQKTANLCTFSIYEDEHGQSISGSYTQDCGQDGLGSPSRILSVIDGSYKGSINNNTSVEREAVIDVNLCTSEQECHSQPGWRVRNGWAMGIRHVRANSYKYSAKRPNHEFLPGVNTKSTMISRGCVSDAAGSWDPYDDGICNNTGGWSFYTTDLQFGSATTEYLSYSTYTNGYHANDRDTWGFDTLPFDTKRYGTFSVFSVISAIDFYKDSHFVIWGNASGGHWAGSTQNNNKPISSIIEDNYGNRFKFTATLFAEPNSSGSKNTVLTRIKDESCEPILR
ncbi:hypothetical protein FLL65_08815 [Vibrio cholerae]|uniref:hypothetical protein n=1 Tax=Vibrio cholerae TaxID=666 RepID=UPI00115BAB5C|nr:hypothetical protein [Vibrio cholerae]TQQ48781.1 hypothetical protein FLL65_08815 [Vibrio cholerae]